VNRIFSSFFDIRKGEYLLSFLMVFYYYLVLVTYYFLKPARDSLFLVKLGASQLPIVFILIAVVVIPVTTVYAKFSRSLAVNRLITWTTLIVVANLLILRWLLQVDQNWIFYLFYIWVSIYGILMTSQAWLFANLVFDAAQAKRIFALIGLGGILGATTGGEVTNLVVNHLGVHTENLLFFCMGLLVISLGIAGVIWSVKKRDGEAPAARARPEGKRIDRKKENFADMFRMIARSRHLVFIVGIIAMTMMTASFVDFQFKSVSVAAFPAKEDLTSFLGKFYGRLSIVSLLLQFLFTNRFVRLLGVGGAILFLPAGLIAGSLAMFIYPGLIAGVLLRGADGSLKYSIDKTGRELLFLPVPVEVKKRTKLFIDMFVDRWFRGLAGALLLLFTLVLNFSVRQLSVVVLVLLAIWGVLALLIRREYVNAFRRALERREIDLSELRIHPDEAATRRTLIAVLDGDNERQVNFALEMLRSVKDPEVMSAVAPLIAHESADVRLNAIKVLHNQQDGSLSPDIEKLLKDSDLEVRLQAMRFLCHHSTKGEVAVLDGFLKDEDPSIQAAALVCASEVEAFEEGRIIDSAVIDRLTELEGEIGVECRMQVARALASARSPSTRAYLHRLLNDPAPEVVEQALHSASRTLEREFVPVLMKTLRDRTYHVAARNALAAYGDRILGTLFDHLRDDSVPMMVRRSIPRILSDIASQHAANTLAESLSVPDPRLKYHVVKAMNRLKKNYPALEFEQDKVNEALIEESKSYYRILQIIYYQESGNGGPPARLLQKALEEKLDQNLERIFRLLALCYEPDDIYSAYQGYVSSRKDLRANAVEFLDNVLGKDLKKFIFPIVDQISAELTIRRGRHLFDLRVANMEQGLEMLIKGGDAWLKTCAIYAAAKQPLPNLLPLIEEAGRDPNPMVKETAEFASAELKS
jgi:ATP/ADP translocase/HEAT repeat protein